MRFFTSQNTPFTAAQLFALVNDVAKYSEFLPGCLKSTVLSQNEQEVIAELSLNFGPLTQEFATKNTLNYPQQIKMTKLYGPFKKLEGIWQFQDLPQGCQISLSLEYEFNTKMLSLMLNPMFSKLTNSMVNAFIARATHIYS